MEQRQALGMRLRDALVETHGGYLHQQCRLLILIREVEIMTHHRLNDKSPVEMIGPRYRSTRHQMILFTTDHHRLRQFVVLRISIEGASLSIKPHLWISTHINGTVQSRLQKLNVKTKLVLISPSRRVI